MDGAPHRVAAEVAAEDGAEALLLLAFTWCEHQQPPEHVLRRLLATKQHKGHTLL